MRMVSHEILYLIFIDIEFCCLLQSCIFFMLACSVADSDMREYGIMLDNFYDSVAVC